MFVVVATSADAAQPQGWLQCDVALPTSLVDVVEPGDDPVLVIGEQRDSAAVHKLAATLSNRDFDRPIAVRTLPHSPLALRELAKFATTLDDLDPGLAVDLVDRVAEQTYSAAWVHTVAGLQDPAPSVGQHLRSWFPGGERFLVTHNPVPGVSAVAAARAAVMPEEFDAVVRERLLQAGGAPATVLDSLTRLSGTRSVVSVSDSLTLAHRYGTDRAAEFVALPADPRALLVDTTDLPTCTNCRHITPSGTCSFCRRQAAPVSFGGTE